MEPIDLHHLSAIRIGDRIVYNGVGGNAFAFGEKPDLAAFALGPYPNPNVPESPITKSRTEPNFRKRELNSAIVSTEKNECCGKEDKSERQESPTQTPVTMSSDKEDTQETAAVPKADNVSMEEPKHAAYDDSLNPFSEEDEPDATCDEPQPQPQLLDQQPSPANDKNSSTSSSSSAKKKKADKKLTLKEVALMAETSKSQHHRTRSWGAFTNLGSKIVNSTTALMTYTANTTMNTSQRALPLPPPHTHRKLPQIPQSPLSFQPIPLPPPEKVAAPSSTPLSKNSSTSSTSSKSSSTSATSRKLSAPQITLTAEETQPEKRGRPLSMPPPTSVGLPPILPRPPAAHLPPPLPSRPPAALRLSCPSSPTSSIKSSVSQRPSPDDDSDSDINDQNDLADSASGKDTRFSHRSTGLVRQENKPTTSSSSATCSSKTSTSLTAEFPNETSEKGRFRSHSPFGAKLSTCEKKSSFKTFSAISAVAVGTPGPTLAPQGVSKSPTPNQVISHHVSVSTPDLRSQPTDKQPVTTTPIHSSDDEGVFEGTNTSDTLSASENEADPTVPTASNKDKHESDQKRRKKMTKQRSLDSGKSNEIKKANIEKFQKEAEKDETVLKNKRTWFFQKKNNEGEGLNDPERCGCGTGMELTSNPIPDPPQKVNDKEKKPPIDNASKQKYKKSTLKSKIKLDNSPNCRKCRVKFGFRFARNHCHRCRLAFCIVCAPVTRCDLVTEDQEFQAPSLVKLCSACKDELLMENSRGATRGLWSEFQKMRAEARDNRGLDVTSSTLHKHLESESVLDATPGLRNLCIKFLVALHQQLQKQPRHKFLANYLHFENPIKQQQANMKKVKNCHACERYLRITSDIRECGICKQVFCMACTWKTLQVFLPKGTDLRADIQLEMIHFHVKETEVLGKGEITAIEASEVYRVCASCEDVVARNIHVNEFDAKVPQLEAELFDLQRQIDHCLTFSPYMFGMQRSVSAAQINRMEEEDFMATCMKHANRLYDRYTRTYDILNKLMPQTGGQKALHKHIKQAMYDFYLKRRDQLKTTWRRRDSCENISENPNTPTDDVPSLT